MRLHDLITETPEHEVALTRLANEIAPRLLASFNRKLEKGSPNDTRLLVGKLDDFVEDWSKYPLPEEFKFLRIYLRDGEFSTNAGGFTGIFTRLIWAIDLTIDYPTISSKNIITLIHELRHAFDFVRDKRYETPIDKPMLGGDPTEDWIKKHPGKDSPWETEHAKHAQEVSGVKEFTTAYAGSAHEINARVSTAMNAVGVALRDNEHNKKLLKTNGGVQHLVVNAMNSNNLIAIFMRPEAKPDNNGNMAIPYDNRGFKQIFKRLYMFAQSRLEAVAAGENVPGTRDPRTG